jgi:hypothetical protein
MFVSQEWDEQQEEENIDTECPKLLNNLNSKRRYAYQTAEIHANRPIGQSPPERVTLEIRIERLKTQYV